MRNIDEQLSEIMERSGRLEKKRILKRQIAGEAVASALCLIALVVLSAFMPAIQSSRLKAGEQRYGSLILSPQHLGYVITGIIAFVLGVCVTLLCLNLRRMKNDDRGRD